MARVLPTTEPDALTLRPPSGARGESQFVRRRLFALLHAGILLCMLLPFVTLGASCSEVKTEPLTGYELVSGKEPVIVDTGSVDNGYYGNSEEDLREVHDRYDVARTGAIAFFVLSLLALGVVFWPYRETAKAAIAFTLLSLVALGVIFQPSAEAGDAHIGLGLAYVFVLATLFADVFVFRRVGGRVSPAGAVLLVLGIPASQFIGIALGSALGP